MSKICKRCNVEKPEDEFYFKYNQGGKSYRRGTCKQCYIQITKTQAKPYDSETDYLRRVPMRYGISVEQYQNLLAKQSGKCAICKQESKRRLCIDHCHQTNQVRGLLCHHCNRALGLMQDSPEIIRSMLSYLKSSVID